MSHRSRRALAAGLGLALALPALTAAAAFPSRIDLPPGYAPEGITAGTGPTAYIGSLATGEIREVDLRTGTVSPLTDPLGVPTVGIDYDSRTDRLWAAGGPTGQVRVYDATSGDLLPTYELPEGTRGFLNDVAITEDAVYVTDSNVQQLVVVPLGEDGALPPADALTTLPLSGDLAYIGGFNANGIVDSGGWLVVVQSATGLLFRVDPATGDTVRIETGASVTFGDGLELVGRTLYVVRNQLEEIAVLRLSADLTSARLVDTIAGTGTDVPTTVAFAAGRLWAANARFGTTTTEYWISRLPAR